jgi:ring-1,2-phenylacetyl-CoA epoxidase subunit PaaC
MSQDEIGHARLLYEMLQAETGIRADKIAYARQPNEFLCCRLVEHRRLDWAHAIARHFLYDTADHVRLEALSRSTYEPLMQAAGKIIREEKYHLLHADMWMNRLATRTDDSRSRLITALESLWPDALAIFEPLPGEEALINDGILPATMADMQAEWLAQIAPYFHNLDLPFPATEDTQGRYTTDIQPTHGGRSGQHIPEFTELWEEMTSVYRLDPEAVW